MRTLFLSVLLMTQSRKLSSEPQCFIMKAQPVFKPELLQDGDIIIGGIFTVHYLFGYYNINDLVDLKSYCTIPLPSHYRYVLGFIFAIDEINKNPDILPNVTLGYHVTDSCSSVNMAIENVLQILSGPGDIVPNYSCTDNYKLAGVIGDHSSKTSLQIANILNIYGYPQISYGATDTIFTNKKIYPYFFQTLPSDQVQFLAIVKLMKYFGWTWFGVVASDDDGGRKQSQELKIIAEALDICIEFILLIGYDDKVDKSNISAKDKSIFNKSTSKVVVLCGPISYFTVYFIELESSGAHEKTVIIPAGSNFQILLSTKCKAYLHGSLVFSLPTKKIPHMRTFLEDVSPANRPNDLLLEHILARYFNCSTSNPVLNNAYESYFDRKLNNCSKSLKLTNIGNKTYNTYEFGTTYLIYKSVYAMAHAIHEMQIYMSKNHDRHIENYKHMLKKYTFFFPQYFLRKIKFQDPMGEDVYFNEKAEMATYYVIRNVAILAPLKYALINFGEFHESSTIVRSATVADFVLIILFSFRSLNVLRIVYQDPEES
ncbi:vomeronasal type-2 receptor [Pristimantis euphronides]